MAQLSEQQVSSLRQAVSAVQGHLESATVDEEAVAHSLRLAAASLSLTAAARAGMVVAADFCTSAC
jgi:hypothetical protein